MYRDIQNSGTHKVDLFIALYIVLRSSASIIISTSHQRYPHRFRTAGSITEAPRQVHCKSADFVDLNPPNESPYDDGAGWRKAWIKGVRGAQIQCVFWSIRTGNWTSLWFNCNDQNVVRKYRSMKEKYIQIDYGDDSLMHCNDSHSHLEQKRDVQRTSPPPTSTNQNVVRRSMPLPNDNVATNQSGKPSNSHRTAREKRKTWICPYEQCDKSFSKRAIMESHINRVHRNVKPYECKVSGCDWRFYDPESQRKHYKSTHLDWYEEQMKDPNGGPICPSLFPMDSYKEQMKVKNQIVRNVVDAPSNPLKVNGGITASDEVVRNVVNGGSTRSDIGAPERKRRRISYECSECGMSFNSECTMIDHRNRIHLHQKPRIPNTSNVQSKSNDNITRKKKKVQCNVCQRMLSSNRALDDHMRLHNGKKPWKCALCGKREKSMGAMTGHIRRNHRTEYLECRKNKNTKSLMVEVEDAVHNKSEQQMNQGIQPESNKIPIIDKEDGTNGGVDDPNKDNDDDRYYGGVADDNFFEGEFSPSYFL